MLVSQTSLYVIEGIHTSYTFIFVLLSELKKEAKKTLVKSTDKAPKVQIVS